MKKIIGLGNALTDILINLPSDELLSKFGLPKGGMTLVEAATQRLVQQATADMPRTLSLGGSAANTIRAMARLGVPAGYIGKVGRDSTGGFFEAALANLSIEPFISYGTHESGCCLSLVSPDGERTMATYLGAATEMGCEDITSSIFEGYDCLYVEGFQVQNHAVILHAVESARRKGLRVAIDLASYNIVLENLDFLRRLVADHVDIVFANEQEAEAFTGEDSPQRALAEIARLCELAVVKVGTRGAYIKRGAEELHVGIMAAARRVDTTGAGDFYAAGFMAGLCEGLSLRQCGTIGAIAAGKVIEVVGTTFGEDAWTEIFSLISEVKTEKCLF